MEECFKMQMLCSGVGEDKAGKEGEAGNPVGLSMEPDEASRSRSQLECDRWSLNRSQGDASRTYLFVIQRSEEERCRQRMPSAASGTQQGVDVDYESEVCGECFRSACCVASISHSNELQTLCSLKHYEPRPAGTMQTNRAIR